MGKIFCKLWQSEEVKILIFGLDAAGKTTSLYRLKLGEVVTTIPTIGFNVESIDYKNVKITAWDVGGRDKMRPLFRHYFPHTDAFLFLFDSNDKERFAEALEEFTRFVNEDELRDCVILAIANKQDLPNAMTMEEIEAKIKEKKIIQTQTWKVFPAVATTGDGLYEALDWLKDQLALKKTIGYFRYNEHDTTTVTKDQKAVPNFNSKFEHFKESLLKVKSLFW
ncbi:hypothetical protein CHS0354_011722 [Potamilus streckersoni]|uniref:ADP-ribosylation factor n=1 Tax=Potamilus streckersoni TaxID=2493646 RepID=A0AAE0VXL0_9BIVA|nr:hypothetical protein CHS0354_011722 [Potamilus streckersoni]